AEPVKPAAPSLPPPRLVKTAKPATEPAAEAELEAPPAVEALAPETGSASRTEASAAPEVHAEARPDTESVPSRPIEEQPEANVLAAAPAAEPVVHLPGPGRIIPPTLRLRIEEQRPTTPTPPLPTALPRS